MRLLFATLLCHRDIEYFLFNWFTMRVFLDHGFDIPHLVLNDGTLTQEDFSKLSKLPNLYIERAPVSQYENVPKPIYLAKLECFKVGFQKYGADRVVVLDCDIFFFKNWDSDLRKICCSPSIALRDWGSSLGPNVEEYRQLYGVHEDTNTPNCNTGICSISVDQYYKLERSLEKHLSNPFLIMEDQGVMFGAYYGQLEYINGIVCAVAGGESVAGIKDWWFSKNACHLMGMRTRIPILREMISHSLKKLPESLALEQLPIEDKQISWGLLEFGTYCFNSPLQYYPSTYNGSFITDAAYLHGGSQVIWKIPPRCLSFTARLICMDSGLPNNCLPVLINGREYPLESDIDIELSGKLEIVTPNGPGTHYAFLSPKVKIDKTIGENLRLLQPEG